MKRYAISTLLAASLVLAGSGCVTTESGKRVLDEQKIAQLAPALATTTAGAVVYAYSKDTNSVKYIAIIRMALGDFLLEGDLQPSSLQAKIFALPIKELKTPEAQLIITPILAAYKAYAEQYIQAGIQENVGLRMLLKSILDGIDSGLAGVGQIQSAEPATTASSTTNSTPAGTPTVIQPPRPPGL